jgi:5-methyltetrahydrofolate--homocysteine methyltransferase
MTDLAELTAVVIKGNRNEAKRLTQLAVDEQLPARQILDALVAGMDEVGRRFQRSEVFVPEMLIAARAMKEALALLEPTLVKAGIKPELTAIIGTVQGDLHDIGKNLVTMMWRGANFNVIDLGVNVPAERFIAAINQHQPQVVGLSALLTTTMPAMQQTVAALRQANITAKIVVGGAPVTQDFARTIGADGYSPDAAGAVELIRRLCPAA